MKREAILTLARRWMWVGVVAFGLFLVGIGVYMASQGYAAKNEVRSALADEQVVTADDAVQFGVPAGVPVDSYATAMAQADTIKLHSLERFGTYTSMERDDPNRATYVDGLTLRNSLNLAAVGFKVSDLVIGLGALIAVLGAVTVLMLAPLFYWVHLPEPKRELGRATARQVAPAPAA